MMRNSGEGSEYPRTIQQIFAIGTEPAFFTVEVIERQGIMHDAFRGHAVVKPKEMAYFVGTLFHRTVDQVILAPGSPIKLIGEAGGGHDCSTGHRTCKTKQR